MWLRCNASVTFPRSLGGAPWILHFQQALGLPQIFPKIFQMLGTWTDPCRVSAEALWVLDRGLSELWQSFSPMEMIIPWGIGGSSEELPGRLHRASVSFPSSLTYQRISSGAWQVFLQGPVGVWEICKGHWQGPCGGPSKVGGMLEIGIYTVKPG